MNETFVTIALLPLFLVGLFLILIIGIPLILFGGAACLGILTLIKQIIQKYWSVFVSILMICFVSGILLTIINSIFEWITTDYDEKQIIENIQEEPPTEKEVELFLNLNKAKQHDDSSIRIEGNASINCDSITVAATQNDIIFDEYKLTSYNKNTGNFFYGIRSDWNNAKIGSNTYHFLLQCGERKIEKEYKLYFDESSIPKNQAVFMNNFELTELKTIIQRHLFYNYNILPHAINIDKTTKTKDAFIGSYELQDTWALVGWHTGTQWDIFRIGDVSDEYKCEVYKKAPSIHHDFFLTVLPCY